MPDTSMRHGVNLSNPYSAFPGPSAHVIAGSKP